MILRPATEADIAALADVAARSYRAAFADILDAAALDIRTPGFFAERFVGALKMLVAAEREGAILGFSLMANGHIDMLFVDPSCQGGGVGGRLLAEAEARGARSLECFRANFAARGFYEGHGWRLVHAYARVFAGAEHAFVRYEKPGTEGQRWSGAGSRRRSDGSAPSLTRPGTTAGKAGRDP